MAEQSTSFAGSALAQRLRQEVDRAVQRSLRGVEYLGSPEPLVGATPKQLLYRDGTLALYHYTPMEREVYRVPILFVMATTNKAFVFDMAPGQSLIEFLLKRGHDIYVMDWNPPTMAERNLRFEDYILRFIPESIRRVQEDSGEQDVSLIGYCFGGVLSVIYAALFPDGPVRNLACFTTPIDFREMKLFHKWSSPENMDVDRMVDSLGLIPPEMITTSFDMLRPASRAVGQIRLWDNLWNDEYVAAYRRMERWGNETLPLAGEYFRQITRELMQKNALYNGELEIGGKPVDLGRIKVPLLHVMAKFDHIVPPTCGRPLIEKIGSTDKEEVIVPGGHVSIVAGANAVRRMWPKLNQWLERRST